MGKMGGGGQAGGGFYGFEVNDTSLVEHGIKPGDVVIVEFTAEIRDGELYIVRLGNDLLSRHLYSQDEKLRVVAANGDSLVLETDSVEVLGRIVRQV